MADMHDAFIMAAENMEWNEHGACNALFQAGGMEWLSLKGVFSAMFRPSRGAKAYWFGGGHPQRDLLGSRHSNARAHRVYALLLAAEAWEDFV